MDLMERLLTNPLGCYYLEPGNKCYIATDNVGGARTITAIVDHCKMVDGKDGYELVYRNPEAPYNEVNAFVPARQVFKTLEEVSKIRKTDTSLQDLAIRNACADPMGLVVFLLSRANLYPEEREIVVRRARDMGIYPDDPEPAEDGGNADA